MGKRIYLLGLLLLAALNIHAVTVKSTAGKLSTRIYNNYITDLTITGSIDARDFKFINDELLLLKNLDLSNATIAEYNSTVEDGLITGSYHYAANTLPYAALMGMIKLKSVVLPSNIVAIDYAALAGCKRLQAISFPSTLQRIGDDAFNSCSELKSVSITGNISYLGEKAFAHCTYLASITINTSVPISIGNEAFADCVNLSSVTIGPKVNAIGDGAFSYCKTLRTINFMDGSQIESIGDKAFYESRIKELNFNKLPHLKHLGAWALAKTHLLEVELPAHVKQLDEGTFFYNNYLYKLELPRTLTYLPDYMLAGCSNLRGTQFMTRNLGNIGDYALYNQAQHSSITVHNNVYYIGTKAMAGMIGLTEITSKPIEVPELGDDVWAGIKQSEVNLYVSKASYNDYLAANQWMNFLISNAQLRGDVNSDGFVNAKDAQAERRYIIENYTQGINIDLTDVSGDGEVNVADIVSIYNIINGTEPFYKPYRTYFQDLIDGNGVAKSNTSVTLDILLENTINYTAFQLDIVTPSHLSVNSAKLSGRCIGHDLYFIEKEPNNYSIYCFSPAGDDIEGYSGVLLTLDISSTKKVSDDDIISLKEINFVDQDEKVYRRHEKSINLIGNTAIENITNDDSDLPVNVYNTQGQLLRQNIPASEATQGLPAGIYIVGNKKVIVR